MQTDVGPSFAWVVQSAQLLLSNISDPQEALLLKSENDRI